MARPASMTVGRKGFKIAQPLPILHATSAKKSLPTTALPPVLVSQTYRLPADLVKELIKVAVSRKLDRTAPWAQQDIVAEAIRDWLTKHASR